MTDDKAVDALATRETIAELVALYEQSAADIRRAYNLLGSSLPVSLLPEPQPASGVPAARSAEALQSDRGRQAVRPASEAA